LHISVYLTDNSIQKQLYLYHNHNQSQYDIYIAPLTVLDSDAEQNKMR